MILYSLIYGCLYPYINKHSFQLGKIVLISQKKIYFVKQIGLKKSDRSVMVFVFLYQSFF